MVSLGHNELILTLTIYVRSPVTHFPNGLSAHYWKIVKICFAVILILVSSHIVTWYDCHFLCKSKVDFNNISIMRSWNLCVMDPRAGATSVMVIEKLSQQTHQHNRPVSQMQGPLAACLEPAGNLWQLCQMLYVFTHKTQYLLIHAPFTRIVVFWHIGNIPPVIL